MIEESVGFAYGRAGLLGNPADGYGQPTISFTFNNFFRVKIQDSLEFRIDGQMGFQSHLEYNGTHDLIKATLKKSGHLCGKTDKKLEVSYNGNIPYGSGLSGSTAIIIATLRALDRHYGTRPDFSNLSEQERNDYLCKMAEIAMHIEIDELGITAGPQDRYAISYGGVNFMDFTGKENLRINDPYGKITRLSVSKIPMFFAYAPHGKMGKDSGKIHNSLRNMFEKGSEKQRRLIMDHMKRFGELAIQGVDPLIKGDWQEVGRLMNENQRLRNMTIPELDANAPLISYLEEDQQIIERARKEGALGAKVAGSGGAVIILGSENPIQFNNLLNKMLGDYRCQIPKITEYQDDEF